MGADAKCPCKPTMLGAGLMLSASLRARERQIAEQLLSLDRVQVLEAS